MIPLRVSLMVLSILIQPNFAFAQADISKLTSDPLGVAAVELLDLALNQQKVDEAIEKYIAPPYTQHNPMVPDGIEGARAGLKGLLKQIPDWHYDFKRVIVDGNMVVVHSLVTTKPAIAAWRSSIFSGQRTASLSSTGCCAARSRKTGETRTQCSERLFNQPNNAWIDKHD